MVFVLSAVTLVLYFLSKPAGFDLFKFPLTYIAQMLGLLGAVYLSLNFILSARFPIVENYFGGLDKSYKFHHVLGSLAFVTALAHPLSMVVKSIPDASIARMYLIPSGEFSYNMGILAVYSLIVVLFFTFMLRLPYQHWLSTHRLMGIPLFLGFLHALYIDSDISVFLPLRLWIVGWLLMALISYLYKVILYGLLGPTNYFVVSRLNRLGNIYELYLKPLRSGFQHQPGQFVFVTIPGLSSESHPFSISSPPHTDDIRLSIKVLGDYTSNLSNLKVGETAKVVGPYGQFYKPFLASKPVVMIAGGIGVTPFLSMLNHELSHSKKRDVYIYYSVATEKEAEYLPELQKLSAAYPRLKVFTHFTDKQGYITADKIVTNLAEVSNHNFLICGPKSFMESISSQLQYLGVSSDHIFYEDFALLN